MSSEMSGDRFVAAFRIPILDLPCGKVYTPDNPIAVEQVRSLAALGASRWFEPVLDFEWASPLLWMIRLSVLHVGRSAAFVFFHESGRPIRAIAAIVARDHSAVFSEFCRSLIGCNGSEYRAPLFGSLPSGTINHAPDLVRAELVRQGYLSWMRWAESIGADPWAQLAERVGDGLGGLHGVGSGGNVSLDARQSPQLLIELTRRAKQRERRGAARQCLLRLYFSTTYREHGR